MTARAGGWRSRAEASLRDGIAAADAMLREGLDALLAAAGAMRDALDRGGSVLVFGNGGSAAQAQHFAAELVGRFLRDRGAMPALALTTDTSTLTAIANDHGFDRVFARQIEALGRAGDVVLAISTSGRSPNVVRGLEAARAKGLVTIGLTGAEGGAMAGLVDVHVRVPRTEAPRVQEVQLMLVHLLAELLEAEQVEQEQARPPDVVEGAVGPARPAGA